MGGRVAKRVLLAPIVVVIATAAVPPATATFSPLKEWLNKAAPAVEPVSSANNLDITGTLARAGQATLHLLNEWRAHAVPATVAVLSSANDWLAVNVPPPPVAVSFHRDGLTDGPRPTERVAAPVVAELPDERPVLASLGIPAAPIQAQEAKTPPAVTEVKSPRIELPAEKPVYASLGLRETISDARTALADPLPAQDTKISSDVKIADDVKIVSEAKPQETPAEEKKVYASLGVPAAAKDTLATPAPLPREETVVSSHPQPEELSSKAKQEDYSLNARPEEMQVRVKHVYASLGSSASVGDIARRERIETQALPRPAADGAQAEKHASLGPVLQSNTYTPPEKTRIAYDAPVVSEQPKSIGKRKYVDDTNYTGLGSPEALLEALRHMGANAKTLGLPSSLWCADFMNMVLRKTGIEATGSRAARSYLKYGKKIDEPRVGAIAIFTRGQNGGHIGIVRGTDGKGNPIIVSGNHNNKVAEALYPKERVLAYVVPRDTH